MPYGIHQEINSYFSGGYSRERCGAILEEILQHYEESLESHIATDYAARVDRPYIYAKNTVYRMPEH